MYSALFDPIYVANFFQVLRFMDTLLFNLLVLQTISDSKGQMWRVNPKDLYIIEVTLPQVNKSICSCMQFYMIGDCL